MTSQLPADFARTPTGRPNRRIFHQRWQDLSFIHWAVDPELVAPLLPPGTRPDIFDGSTYVGLVPFHMRKIGILGSAAVPYFGDFPETNVRLYSVDDAGRHGVVFRSLEATRLATTMVARVGCNIPYTWAKMRIGRRGSRMRYLSTRRWPSPGLACAATVEIGPPITPTDLDIFLTARWGLHVYWQGQTRWWPNWHAPWELYETRLLDLQQDLTTAAGLPPLPEPDVPTRYSPGVVTVFGTPISI